MAQESTSFWADIKKYEDMLAKDPRSYCFAPLAELYRKLGLLDDAINVAAKGCEVHPDYVVGFMALGRAFYEKGLKEESKAALERVIRGTPDNHLAQKLLSHIYIEAGDTASAEKSLRTILSLYPDDLESQVLLKSLEREVGAGAEPVSEFPTADAVSIETDAGDLYSETLSEANFDLEDAEIIEDLTEEIDALEGEYLDDATNDGEITIGSGLDDGERKDPLRTATLAELYVSQGMLTAALEIYGELLATEPDNHEYGKRMCELREMLANEAGVDEYMQAATVLPLSETSGTVADIDAFAATEHELAPTGTDTTVVATLEKWLENIKGRR